MQVHVVFKKICSSARDKAACRNSGRVKVFKSSTVIVFIRCYSWDRRLRIRLRCRFDKGVVPRFLFRAVGEVDHIHVVMTYLGDESGTRFSDLFKRVEGSIYSLSRLDTFRDAQRVLYAAGRSLSTGLSLAIWLASADAKIGLTIAAYGSMACAASPSRTTRLPELRHVSRAGMSESFQM